MAARKTPPTTRAHRITQPKVWWGAESTDNVAGLAFAVLREQYMLQESRYRQFRKFAAVYEYGARASEQATVKDKTVTDAILAYNRSMNAVDSLVADVCAAKIGPMFSTIGGTWSEQQDAKTATRAMEGTFEELHFDEHAEDVILDAASMSGTGLLKVYADLDACKVVYDRAHPLDIVYPEAETRYRQPRQMMQRMVYDRACLAEQYGVSSREMEKSARARRDAIMDAPSASPGELYDVDDSLVEVVECWHLPSRYAEGDDDDAETSGDGRHVICIENLVLLDEEWRRPRFPFAEYTPRRPRTGFWGIPFMRQCAPAQRELERLDERIQRAARRMGGAYFLVHKSAKVNERKLANDAGVFVEYEGTGGPPTEWTPAMAHPQFFDYRERLASEMLRFAGRNEMGAQGQVPAGLSNTSGKALNTFIDEGSKYIGNWLRARERFTVDTCDLTLDAIEQLVEKRPNLTARYKDGPMYEVVEWRRIIEGRERMVLNVTPINGLASSPSGKLAQVTEWYNSKAIDDKTWRKMSGLPDLEAQNALDMSFGDLIMKTLDAMVKDGAYRSPEPFYPLDMAKETASKFYCMISAQGVPEAAQKLVRQYIADCDALMQPPPEQPLGELPQPPGPPGGMPAPMPGGPMDPAMMGAPPPPMPMDPMMGGAMPPGMAAE